MRRCAFLDRDGTVIVDRGYLNDPSGVELLPGAAEGLLLLREMGYFLVMISNQSGVGRGRLTRRELAAVNRRMLELLERHGVRLDGIYCCEHREDQGCPCRKPGTALAQEAARRLCLDLEGCVVIGDKTSDVMLGRRLGCLSILVKTGMGGSDGGYAAKADLEAADLLEAAKALQSGLTGKGGRRTVPAQPGQAEDEVR